MRQPLWLLLALGPLLGCSGGEDEAGVPGAPGSGGTMSGAGGQGGAAAGAGQGGFAGSGVAGTAAGTAGIAGGSGAGAGGLGGASGGGAGPAGDAGIAGLAGGGAAGTAGAAGSGGMTPGLDSCPAPPEGAPDEAVVALNTENELRLAMGLDCATLVNELITSAQNHCDYYVQNQGDATCEAPSPHDEIMGCPGYTGEGLGERMRAAGYMGRGGSECMAFTGDPVRSTMMFVNSVYHRTPVLDPWTRELGYGFGDGCDTIDYGTGAMTAADVTAFYPYAGQTDVPTSFDGSREGPEPPMPTTGWPSGFPITLYAKNVSVSSHSIVVDGTADELLHQWLDSDDPTLPDYAKVLYTDAPLTANTTYRVAIDATRDTAPLHFEWTFTTGAAAGGRPGR